MTLGEQLGRGHRMVSTQIRETMATLVIFAAICDTIISAPASASAPVWLSGRAYH